MSIVFKLVSRKEHKFVLVHNMKAYRGVQIYLHSFLNSVLEGSGQLSSSAGLPRENIPRFPLSRWLGGSRAGLGVLEKRKYVIVWIRNQDGPNRSLDIIPATLLRFAWILNDIFA